MDDDFFEKDDNIFGGDEVLDYIIYEEVEKELGKKKNNAGCLNTLFAIFSTFGGFTILVLWIIR